MRDLVIFNARIVTPVAILEGGTVVIRDGRIETLSAARRSSEEPGTERVDARGRLLLPGFVDLHNDGIEQEIEPRPRAVFPLSVAFPSLENRLVSHGITTIFHSFAFMDGTEGTVRADGIEPAVRELNVLRRTGIIRHLIHARYELVETQHFERVCRLIDDGQVNLVSFMDHTPGQGQYRNVQHLMNFYQRKYHAELNQIEAVIREREEKARNPAVAETLDRLIAHARRAGLPLASHDDDSPQKVTRMRGLGVTISEFPVEASAAEAARAAGMHVAVGAPNVLRGQSTNGNMSAREAVESRTADILCSDYYSPSILHAVFRLAREGILPLPEAVRLATAHPARAAGLHAELGSLEPGKRADMILVSESAGAPSVVSAWVGGHRVYERHDGALDARGELWAREAGAILKDAANAS